MEKIVSGFRALASGGRWLFDLASMAVGVAPTSCRLDDSFVVDGDAVAFGGKAMTQTEFHESELESAIFRHEMGLTETWL